MYIFDINQEIKMYAKMYKEKVKNIHHIHNGRNIFLIEILLSIVGTRNRKKLSTEIHFYEDVISIIEH